MGGNLFGQLGIGNKKGAIVPTKVRTGETVKFKKISAGHHTAAISREGELYVWGTGVFGEYLSPHKLDIKASKLKEVTVGGSFGLALDESGKLFAWGANTSGELGIGDYEPKASPFPLEKLSTKSVVCISCGGSYAIALGKTHTSEDLSARSGRGDRVNSVITQVLNASPAISSKKEFEQYQEPNENQNPIPAEAQEIENGPTEPLSVESRTSEEVKCSLPPNFSEPTSFSVEKPNENEQQLPQYTNPSVSDVNTAELFSSISQREPHQPVLLIT